MRLMAVLALAGGLVAAPLIAAGNASGLPPSSCDGADCVPGVPRDAALGAHCDGATRYDFGMDAAGTTYLCTMTNEWVKTKPLIGVRPLSAPCDGDPGSAQSPDGLPMLCKDGGWRTDFDAIFYPKTG
jgi:hypothetical protein